MDNKAKGRRTAPSAKTKVPPPRLSDLVREEAKSSENTAAIQPPPRRRPRDSVQADEGPIPTAVQSGVASNDGRLERAGLPPKEALVEQAVIERREVSERPHRKHFDAPDEAFQRAVDTMRGIFQAVRADVPFSIHSTEEAAERLLTNLQASDALMLHVFTAGGPTLDPPLEAVNVCILAVKFGMELAYTEEELRRLSLAALLHDVGMARLPEGLVEKKGPFNPVERATLGRHSEEGAKIIRRLGPEYTWLVEVVLQVHERVDGSGYPKALEGTDFHEYAQVVGLADVYESLVHQRAHRRRLSPLEALKEVLNQERSTFSDRILKALIQALSPYPVGSLVRLNTGEIGRVVAKNKDRPLRPVINVLVRGGKQLEEPVVTDLGQSPLLNIQDSIVEETL